MQAANSDRLLLRMFRESDLDAYAEMCGDAEVMRYLGDGHTFTRAEAWRNMALVIGHWQLRGFGLWAVEERSTGLLAGRVGCWQPEGWPGFEVGWALAASSGAGAMRPRRRCERLTSRSITLARIA